MRIRPWPLVLVLAPGLLAQAKRKKAPEPVTFDAGFPGEPKAERPEHPIDIKSDHLTVLGKDNIGIFKGHVHAVRVADKGQPDLHILCDEATTHYLSDNKIKSITCLGDVHVMQGDREGWGDRGDFDNDQGTLVVTGHPHGQQGPNRFAGQSLTFYASGDRIEVDQAVVEGESAGKVDGPDGGARDGGAGDGGARASRTSRSMDAGAR